MRFWQKERGNMDKRKEYWDETYVKYWKEKVDASNDDEKKEIVKGDAKTMNDEASVRLFNHVDFQPNEKCLDFGCGFGRFWSYLVDEKKQNYFGIDISEAMINEFVKSYPLARENLKVTEGEKLPFEDEFFDHIVCNGVFDACYQEQALAEILRTCAVGGGHNSHW